MFGNAAASVFDNVPMEHRPDVASTAAPGAVGASPDGLGGGPDGLGAHARPVGEYFSGPSGTGAYATPVDRGGHPQMSGELTWLEPPDASPAATLRTAGITALAAAVFFGGGLALGGPWGGMSGILLSGSGFNVYRAQKWWGSADPSEKYEAVVSAFFATVGLAAGGYAAYKAYEAKK